MTTHATEHFGEERNPLPDLRPLLIQLQSQSGALSAAIIYAIDATPTLLASTGEPVTAFLEILDSTALSSSESTITTNHGLVANLVLLFKVDAHRSYHLLLRQKKSLFSRPLRDTAKTALQLSRAVFDSVAQQIQSEHEIVTTSVTGLLGGYLDANPFTHTLESLLKLSGCVSGSVWEFHDNTQYGDVPFLTVAATAGLSFSDYDQTCLPHGQGVVWDALKPGAPKVQYADRVGVARVVNTRLQEIYSSQSLSLLRLEAGGRIYGVACLYGLRQSDLNDMAARFATFEKVAALALSNKHLRMKAKLLDGLRGVIPTAAAPTDQAVCLKATSNIRQLLNCQAASIFLLDNLSEASHALRLTAVTCQGGLAESEETRAFHSGVPVVYDTRARALTSLVWRLRRVHLANLVSKSEVNSGRYREISDKSNDTWLGVPIIGSSMSCIGVIRCTGKQTDHGGVQCRYIFNSDDIDVLEYFAEMLSRVLETVQGVERLDRLNRRLALMEQIRAHEMYAPLLAILANARLVKTNLDEPAVTSKARRLTDIMTDAEMCAFLLRETRVPSPEEFNRDVTAVSVFNILLKMKDFLARRIQARSPRKEPGKEHNDLGGDYEVLPIMRVEVGGHAPRVLAHPMLLQRALYNIAWNAIKYGRRGGILRMTASVDGERRLAVVDFEDDGIGIEECDRDLIFEEGVRGSNAPSDKYPGSGLGLFLARGILERHGGTIVLSSLRNPTRFQVTLPLADPAEDGTVERT